MVCYRYRIGACRQTALAGSIGNVAPRISVGTCSAIDTDAHRPVAAPVTTQCRSCSTCSQYRRLCYALAVRCRTSVLIRDRDRVGCCRESALRSRDSSVAPQVSVVSGAADGARAYRTVAAAVTGQARTACRHRQYSRLADGNAADGSTSVLIRYRYRIGA